MLYLLDANVLITANSFYYEIDRIPQFWDWLGIQAAHGNVKLPAEMMREITPDRRYNTFRQWLAANGAELTLSSEPIKPYLATVFQQGYGINPSRQTNSGFTISNENDAVLIAYALADKANRKVVTLEGVQITGDILPQPRKRKIPLVCRQLGVQCINTFELIRELDFRIPK